MTATATAPRTKTPETFRVGETVSLYVGEHISKVFVFAVDGDKVTAGFHPAIAKVYAPRADGKTVKVGTPEFAHMPDMIFHMPRVSPAHRADTRWDRVKKFLRDF
jgi:hypothetical protein